MRCYEYPSHPNEYHQPRPGAYGIFMHKGQLLLTFQAGIHNQWQFPGGGVDKGESFSQALIREAYEETGWKVSVERKATIYRRFIYMPDYDIYAEKICHIYTGRAILRMGDPIEQEHSDALINPSSALQMLSDPSQVDVLSKFL